MDRDERSDTEIEPSSEEEADDAANNEVKVNGDGHLRSRKQGHVDEAVSNNNVANGVEAKKTYWRRGAGFIRIAIGAPAFAKQQRMCIMYAIFSPFWGIDERDQNKKYKTKKAPIGYA